ncbi:hypothetical protein IWX65_002374 [Arthrobacter sp. CAN_A214]
MTEVLSGLGRLIAWVVFEFFMNRFLHSRPKAPDDEQSAD